MIPSRFATGFSLVLLSNRDQEAAYNPYYTLVCAKLCHADRRYRFRYLSLTLAGFDLRRLLSRHLIVLVPACQCSILIPVPRRELGHSLRGRSLFALSRSLQLALWDFFKQFRHPDTTPRKVTSLYLSRMRGSVRPRLCRSSIGAVAAGIVLVCLLYLAAWLRSRAVCSHGSLVVIPFRLQPHLHSSVFCVPLLRALMFSIYTGCERGGDAGGAAGRGRHAFHRSEGVCFIHFTVSRCVSLLCLNLLRFSCEGVHWNAVRLACFLNSVLVSLNSGVISLLRSF